MGRFYPEGIRGQAKLPFYTEHFSTVEINGTFYHMPLQKTVQHWYEVTPEAFVFSIKMNRYATHTKHLMVDEATNATIDQFYERVHPLRQKLGIVLVQLPPSMKVDLSRIENLASRTRYNEEKWNCAFALALEFRHESWFTPEVYRVLRNWNIANVINDSPNRWPASREITATRAYLRFHGSRQLYKSRYTDDELRAWSQFITENCGGCEEVYGYFNNDYSAVAVDNARTLLGFVR